MCLLGHFGYEDFENHRLAFRDKLPLIAWQLGEQRQFQPLHVPSFSSARVFRNRNLVNPATIFESRANHIPHVRLVGLVVGANFVQFGKPHYSRTELSGITRAVNRLFPMPAMLLFRHGDTLTLAVINRRLHKLDSSKDVLEKVTLIKDIRLVQPHRAHIEILCDLSLDSLRERHDFSNFVTLHAAWQKSLDSSELNKRFFLEVANWYFWALKYAEFPKDAPKQDGKDHISVI